MKLWNYEFEMWKWQNDSEIQAVKLGKVQLLSKVCEMKTLIPWLQDDCIAGSHCWKKLEVSTCSSRLEASCLITKSQETVFTSLFILQALFVFSVLSFISGLTCLSYLILLLLHLCTMCSIPSLYNSACSLQQSSRLRVSFVSQGGNPNMLQCSRFSL